MTKQAYDLTTLDNGLPVLRVPLPGPKSVTVMALANTGSRYETAQQHGLAHFFEHLVFKGTHRYPEPQLLARTIDGIGADFNAFTSKEYTGYFVKAASKHLNLALDVVSDMILAPLLKSADIDREKGVIIEELNLYHDTPQHHIQDLFNELAFAEPGLSHQIIGSSKSVKALKRADFVDFLKSWYGLPNLILVLAGDSSLVMSDRVLEEVKTAFSKEDEIGEETIGGEGRLSEKKAVRSMLKKKVQQQAVFSEEKLSLETRDIQQAHFVLGWPAYDRHHEKRYAQLLLSNILGGNMSSRLFTEVREKRGLAYYVRAESASYHEVGLLGAAAGVDPKRIEEALEVTIAEFKKATSEAELSRAKEYLTGKLALSHEDSQTVAQYYGLRQLLRDEIKSPEEALAELRAVSLDDVQAVAEAVFLPGELRLALIGPFKDKDRFARFV